MKSTHYPLYLIAFLFCFSCNNDSPMETPDAPPSVNFMGNFTDGATVCAGQTLDLTIEMSAEAGISSYTIFRNTNEELDSDENVIFNNLDYRLSYLFSNEDLENGSVSFTVLLVDVDNRMIRSVISFQVVAEYAYSNTEVSLRPSFDLTLNETVDTAEGSNVDLFLRIFTESCGPFCSTSRFTLVSKNESRFYNLPLNSSINFNNNNYKQADVTAAISGIAADTSLVAYSTFPSDLTVNGFLNSFPIVVDIRGTGEFAVLDAVIDGNGTPQLRYKKRTETSGQ